VLELDGNSVETVHKGRPREGESWIDHLWIRVADLEASERFYEAVGPSGGFGFDHGWPEGRLFKGSDRSFSVIHDDQPLTENVHLAFPAADNATVDKFHRTLVAPAIATTASRASATTTPAITAPSSSTPKATTSKPSASSPSSDLVWASVRECPPNTAWRSAQRTE
jgi:hypothetical protein